MCRARYTRPMPPRPTSASRRQGPSMVPTSGSVVSGIARRIPGAATPRKGKGSCYNHKMPWRRTPAWIFGALCAAFTVALALGSEWNRRLVVAPGHGMIVAAQEGGEEVDAQTSSAGTPRTWQKIAKDDGYRSASYGFVDFKQDKITLSYKIPESAFKRYNE